MVYGSTKEEANTLRDLNDTSKRTVSDTSNTCITDYDTRTPIGTRIRNTVTQVSER